MKDVPNAFRAGHERDRGGIHCSRTKTTEQAGGRMESNDFYTFHEYMKKDETELTASMEDYIEMIFRLSLGNGFTRVSELAQSLNIQPSSATRMVQRLAELGYVKYEKYGFLMLSEPGRLKGAALLHRHAALEKFMRAVGLRDSEVLAETEKIEHMLSADAAACFESLAAFLAENPDVAERFETFRAGRQAGRK